MKVGIVGLGTMGTTHAASYQRIADCELVAVADIQLERCKTVAERYGVRSYASLGEMLASETLDVVDVCLPTHLHREHVEMAAAAGKHVFCEKPLARNRQEGEAMVEACRKAGVTLGIGHVVRFFPEYRRAKEIIESGQLGKVGTVYTYRGGGGFPMAWQDWYANYQWSGGLTLDMIIHDFDFLRWTLGEVKRVYAKSTFGRAYNRLEHVLVSLRFESGAIANVEGSWLDIGGFGTKFEFACEKGLLTYNSKDATSFRSYQQRTGLESVQGVAVPESVVDKDPYTQELEHFVGCLKRGEEPLISGDEALGAVDIAMAALESIKTGNPVTLSSERG